MQLGMIGLGRMGANMVRRLMRGGHTCVVFDRSRGRGEGTGQGRRDRRGLARRTSCRSSSKPRAIWLMVPAARRRREHRRAACRCSRSGDTLIDGGNSYYIDDIRRAKELRAKGIHYVDVGTSGGVWGLERGYCMMIGGPDATVKRLDPIFATLAPGIGDIAAHARPREARRHRRARLPALRPERRRPLREDGAQRHRVRHHGRLRRRPGHSASRQRRQADSTRSTPRRRRCAIPSTTSTISTCATSPRSGGAAA